MDFIRTRRKWAMILALGGIATGIFLLSTNLSQVCALDENDCLYCHGNPDIIRTDSSGKEVSFFVDENALNASAHRDMDCTTCHTGDPHLVDTPLNKQSLAEKCGSCHQEEYREHLESVHGQQLAKGDSDVATCVDCHSPNSDTHGVVSVTEVTAPTYKKNIGTTCAKCHDNRELMQSYGLVEQVYETYMRSFHGKAMALSSKEIAQLDTATCTNCHGVHDIKRVDDPNSPVSGLDNLVQTCDECHPGAGAEFAAGFPGHKAASAENLPAVHYTGILFTALLITVLAFGAVIVIMAIIRFALNKWRE